MSTVDRTHNGGQVYCTELLVLLPSYVFGPPYITWWAVSSNPEGLGSADLTTFANNLELFHVLSSLGVHLTDSPYIRKPYLSEETLVHCRFVPRHITRKVLSILHSVRRCRGFKCSLELSIAQMRPRAVFWPFLHQHTIHGFEMPSFLPYCWKQQRCCFLLQKFLD